jgi:hypothetical protein
VGVYERVYVPWLIPFSSQCANKQFRKLFHFA